MMQQTYQREYPLHQEKAFQLVRDEQIDTSILILPVTPTINPGFRLEVAESGKYVLSFDSKRRERERADIPEWHYPWRSVEEPTPWELPLPNALAA